MSLKRTTTREMGCFESKNQIHRGTDGVGWDEDVLSWRAKRES